jgi:hypothetical protein
VGFLAVFPKIQFGDEPTVKTVGLLATEGNKVSKISRELRVEGLATASNEFINVIIENLLKTKEPILKRRIAEIENIPIIETQQFAEKQIIEVAL